MATPKKQSERLSTMMPTDDNWFGNYPNNMVELIFNSCRRDKQHWVSAWGNDDFGLQSKNLSKGVARRLYRKLKNMKVLNKKTLYDLGFKEA